MRLFIVTKRYQVDQIKECDDEAKIHFVEKGGKNYWVVKGLENG